MNKTALPGHNLVTIDRRCGTNLRGPMGASSTSERDEFGATVAPTEQLVSDPPMEQLVSDPPTEQLVTASVGDRCASCGAPLASDQRYCVVCGERRGKARYPVAALTEPGAETVMEVSGPPPRPRFSSGSAFIAGVGVLLLAMGLGVLIGRIGHTSSTPRASAASPVVVTVGGGGTGTNQSASASTTPTANTGHGKSSGPKVKKIVITKQVAAKATAAASKVLGGATNLAPPTVSQGSKCSSGAGCQNGSFTGNFFGQ